MKVLITGSYCSGKTTLANQLHSNLDNSVLSGEVTREVLKLFGKVDWSIPELRDYIFIKQLIEEQKSSLLNPEYIIVDAGIVSLIAHDRILLKSSPDRLELLKYFKHTKYDVVFFCDHRGITIEDDGERYTDERMRDHLASIVMETLPHLGINKYAVLEGSRSDRLYHAMSILREEKYGQQK
jgi:nicotinamide riboside kinase